MDAPVNVPVDHPMADTEWNDILRQHNIIPPKPPSPTPLIEEALAEKARQDHDNRLEDKSLDELDALEDEEDEEFLEGYRKARIKELAALSKRSIFNQVFFLQKADYAHDVTEASKEAFVLVLLTSSFGTNVESRIATECWRELAKDFGEVKFCEIRADLCIEGYPEKNTPTILVYKDGDIKDQVVTLQKLKGQNTGLGDLKHLLVKVGAINANDHRVLSPYHSSQRNDKNMKDDDLDDLDD